MHDHNSEFKPTPTTPAITTITTIITSAHLLV